MMPILKCYTISRIKCTKITNRIKAILLTEIMLVKLNPKINHPHSNVELSLSDSFVQSNVGLSLTELSL